MHPNQWMSEPVCQDIPLVDQYYKIIGSNGDLEIFPLNKKQKAFKQAQKLSSKTPDTYYSVELQRSNNRGRVQLIPTGTMFLNGQFV